VTGYCHNGLPTGKSSHACAGSEGGVGGAGRGLAERRCDLAWGIFTGNLYLSGGWLVRCKSEKGHHNEHAFKIKETCMCVCVGVCALLMAQF
jgi:hypothetical protein